MKFLSVILIVCSLQLYAQPYRGTSSTVQTTDDRAAGCSPANASTFLEFNNVKAIIHSGGNLWQISGQNFSQYEVPKGSGIMALFTSALWLGGVDVNGQLKIAAVRYRQGNDYWTGPLTEGGEAEIIPSECAKYDKHFTISQDEVRQFDAWFKAGEQDALNGTTLQKDQFADYEIPLSILEWPAHGDPALGQNYYLAPFYDRDKDGTYDPYSGDYPWYDIEKELDCNNNRTVTLYGDKTVWWVMNDKGNIHTETAGDPLGMEIRCQAFAFATNDEVNNMTFYNYELVNRSTQTLYDTYFGVFIDGALGGPNDDYVGCDVSRGLGYTYNGDSFDETDGGYLGYGDNPPACGIDFFEGPYADNDGVDNPLIENYADAKSQNGIPYSGLGIGFGDGIIDNERLGMSRFLYYNNLGGGGTAAQTDPETAQDYYGYLSGYWKDGTSFIYGGSGHPSSTGAIPSVLSNYMFPGESDPIGWGTAGFPQSTWTEQTAGNLPYDRRFAQSSGPFVLKPGAVNNITYGIVWARSNSGDPFESVKELRKADDKAQALFDNCFKVLEGPHAPTLSIQEMENELILTIYNDVTSNNVNEDYAEVDPFIVNVDNNPNFDNSYRFQGYQVYQLYDETVSPTDLDNVELARLVFQSDIKDNISKLVNYKFDSDVGVSVPQLKVDGLNSGVRHSFSITEDEFATGDRRLVNFKKYYYMVISYATNQYKIYDPTLSDALDGQKTPYLASRKAAIGEIVAYEAIPHQPSVEAGGTNYSVDYGFEFALTRVDGWGNGDNWTEISTDSEENILSNEFTNELKYKSGASPIVIKVIDPLNIPNADFRLDFIKDASGNLDSANWKLINLTTLDTVFSKFGIHRFNEQLIPEWGISVTIEQTEYSNKNSPDIYWETKPIGANIIYDDPTKRWLRGIEDSDNYHPTNWIRSGAEIPEADECIGGVIYNPCYYLDKDLDYEQEYEDLLDGTVAPFKLVGNEFIGMPIGFPDVVYDNDSNPTSWFNPQGTQDKTGFKDLHGVDLVITSDNSKWSRCPVIETGHNSGQTEGGSSIMKLRNANSKDINQLTESGKGMSWFPGYAIDVETGERLNIAFGENSWLNGSNGKDMLWNPTDELEDNVGMPILGGSHAIYIFGTEINNSEMPAYDEGNWLYNQLSNESVGSYRNAWKNCMWVMQPLLDPLGELLETDVRIQLRVMHPYQEQIYTGINSGLPSYTFSTSEYHSETNVSSVQQNELDLINVVPNPYYAYSAYEKNQIDNRIKITNLPERCEIKIFNMAGQLVKVLDKDNASTYQDWNLKNSRGVPIASGLYIIHIEVPNVGERILKWYGAMRTVDTDNF
ncbi:MAG: T9SS type A sorting domain-containing protein [Crocinitomicaceae bacterium]|nr:T9SS type A sorting domain-containing protein [Crocinitomicaceae bacterium]